MDRTLSYFVSDVHLGLVSSDPVEREERFLGFLRSIPRDRTCTLYLLGDIWDFWYEYRDVVPRDGIRVVAELVSLMDAGVEVCFFEGNHDIWTFSLFESLGMRKLTQPCCLQIGGKAFCMGHGDGIGGAGLGYRLMSWVFRSHWAQTAFSWLHPSLAFRLARKWSGQHRQGREPYHFRGADEPLFKFALKEQEIRDVDFFVFGHFHDKVDMRAGSARLVVLKDWLEGGMPHAVFDAESGALNLR